MDLSFRIAGCLGKGSFGIVFKVIDSSDTETAVKFQCLNNDDEVIRQEYKTEGSIASKLKRHRNVVQTFCVVQSDFNEFYTSVSKDMKFSQSLITFLDEYLENSARSSRISVLCIQMELCGENLRVWLNSNYSSDKDHLLSTQKRIVTDIILGLMHIHSYNIIHGDLKPENIMFSRSPFVSPVKIGDFGLSIDKDSHDQRINELAMIGTHSYAAPELRSGSEHTFQSDLFSLGLIIWEVMQFVKPGLFERLVYHEELDLLKVNPITSKIILNLIQKDVNHRVNSINALQKTWDANIKRIVCDNDIIEFEDIDNYLIKDTELISNISKYVSFLGIGGYGFVLKAVNHFGAPSAVKFMFPTEAGAKQRQQMLRECYITKDLNHINLVKTLDVENKSLTLKELTTIFDFLPQDPQSISMKDRYIGRSKRCASLDAICIRLELCGENLRTWLNTNIDTKDIQIFRQQTIISLNLIEGLKYLHNNKIMHRDVKPENIMFSGVQFRLPVKLGDFGLCRNFPSEEMQSGSLTAQVGVRRYMAPEILWGIDYSFKADIYSLGLVLWEIAQFVKPNQGWFNRLVDNAEDDLVKIHPIMYGIKKVIVGLTQKNVSERFQSLDDLSLYCEIWANEDANHDEELLINYLPASFEKEMVSINNGNFGFRDHSENKTSSLCNCAKTSNNYGKQLN